MAINRITIPRDQTPSPCPTGSAPPDQPLGDTIGDFALRIAGTGALVPNFDQALGDLLHARHHFGHVALAQIFQADIDDPARVDHIIGSIEDPAIMEALAVRPGGELVVRAAGHHGRPERRDRLFGEDRAQRIGAENVGLDAEDVRRVDRFAAELRRQRLGALRIDVGQGQPRAVRGAQPLADDVKPADVADVKNFVADMVYSDDMLFMELSENVNAGAKMREALAAADKEIRDHQTEMDLFLLSANAMTEDGVIVNIDGRGNRVAASIYGPKRVVYVVGRNKIVAGGVLEAIARAKRMASPPNCVRLGKKTPCAEKGLCADCDSPDRICRVTAIFDRCPSRTSTLVVVVDEDLGY